jgi:hypothetical protein
LDQTAVRQAWYELEKLFGPQKHGRDEKLLESAQKYALAILEENDIDRIRYLGKRHLNLVSSKELSGKQFSIFLTHVITYERPLNY